MAEVRETICDVKGCASRDAVSFHVFSHRASNGVEMEDWDHVFDLCPQHVAALARRLLKETQPGKAKSMLDSVGVTTRLG